MTKLSDINKVLHESDDKLRNISDAVSDTKVIAKQNAVVTGIVASRIGKWIEGEKGKSGDVLEAKRKAERVKKAAVVASRGALNPTATTFTGGLMEGLVTASGLSAVSGFASSVIGSIFGNRALSLNLAARAGTLLGRGAIYGTLAAGVSVFGEDILTKFLNDLDPDDVTFTDEQKANIASRAGDGLTASFISRIFTRNPLVNMAAFVGGAFGDEIYAQFENTFGEDGLKVENPFGIGPDTLDFTKGPLKDALIYAAPFAAAGLLKMMGPLLLRKFALPLAAGAAVGVLEAIGWTGLANLINDVPAPPGSPSTPGAVPSTRGGPGSTPDPLGAGGKADKVIQARRLVAGLNPSQLAALEEAGYKVDRSGRLQRMGGKGFASLEETEALIRQVSQRPSLFTRGLTALRESAIGQKTASAFSSLANSWVGKAGRFLGRFALPLSAALEGFLGYKNREMIDEGMGPVNRVTTGLASGMVGGTLDVGAWLAEKGLGLFGYDMDIPDFSEAIRDAAILQARGEGWRLLNLGKILGARLAGEDPMTYHSVMEDFDPDAYVPPTGPTGLDRLQQNLEDALGAGNFYTDSLGLRHFSPQNNTGNLLDQYFNGTLGGGQGGVYAPTLNQGSTINNNFNSGFVVEGTPTDKVDGGSWFGFIGGGVGNRR